MVTPKYIDNINARKYLRFVEWKAILRLEYGTDDAMMSDAFPAYAGEIFNWQEKYNTYIKRNANGLKASALHIIYLDILNNKIADLDEFHLRLRAEFMNYKSGKALKVRPNGLSKMSDGNQSYVGKGPASVDNDTLLYFIQKAAVSFANTNYTPTLLPEVVKALASESCEVELTHEGLTVLHGIFTKKVNAMEKSITKPEATILRHPVKRLAKNTYHLYGLFKLHCEVGDTWELPLTELTKEQLGVGKPAALEAVDLLIKLKLIEISELGNQRAVNDRATIYKRLK